jgi:hypothetical protein
LFKLGDTHLPVFCLSPPSAGLGLLKFGAGLDSGGVNPSAPGKNPLFLALADDEKPNSRINAILSEIKYLLVPLIFEFLATYMNTNTKIILSDTVFFVLFILIFLFIY